MENQSIQCRWKARSQQNMPELKVQIELNTADMKKERKKTGPNVNCH